MADIDVRGEKVAVPSDEYGGVINGAMLSLVKCPKCQSILRFVSTFDSEVAKHACDLLAKQFGSLIWEVDGTAVVGTATYVSQRGVTPHGRRYRYGYGFDPDACSYLPYYGTERQLAREVWNALHKAAGLELAPAPTGQIDMSALGATVYASDQMGRLPKLLMYQSRLLDWPIDFVYGDQYMRQRDVEKRRRMALEAPFEFWNMISKKS